VWLSIQFGNLFFAELYALMKPAHIRVVIVRSGQLGLIVSSFNFHVLAFKELV